jgi:hypothetical protein
VEIDEVKGPKVGNKVGKGVKKRDLAIELITARAQHRSTYKSWTVWRLYTLCVTASTLTCTLYFGPNVVGMPRQARVCYFRVGEVRKSWVLKMLEGPFLQEIELVEDNAE